MIIFVLFLLVPVLFILFCPYPIVSILVAALAGTRLYCHFSKNTQNYENSNSELWYIIAAIISLIGVPAIGYIGDDRIQLAFFFASSK